MQEQFSAHTCTHIIDSTDFPVMSSLESLESSVKSTFYCTDVAIASIIGIVLWEGRIVSIDAKEIYVDGIMILTIVERFSIGGAMVL